MPDEMKILTEDLRAHASKVDSVVEQLGTAVDASQQVSLDNDAYGIICRPFAWMLDPAENVGVEALRKAAEAMGELADEVRSAAEDYQQVDDDNRALIEGVE
jgi:hypothetical protein